MAVHNTAPKIAIHAHAFYPAIWPELRQCIQNVIDVCGAENIYLCVTYPDDHAEIAKVVNCETYACKSTTVAFPNRGYDVAPFVCAFLNKINLDAYDYIVKLHTKRDVNAWSNFRPLRGSEWRKSLLFFASSKDAVKRTMNAFERYPALGMVSTHRTINYCGSDWGAEASVAKHMLETEYSIFPRHLVTASGTIFMIRANLLKCFQARYTEAHFKLVEAESAHQGYGLASLLEFAFSMRADAAGYIISEGRFPPRLTRAGYAIQSCLFLTMRHIMNFVRKVAH